MKEVPRKSRRHAVACIASAITILPWASAAATPSRLKPTPAVAAGPFYPPRPAGLPFFSARPLSPLPTGNDLTMGRGGCLAEGDRILISGRILSTAGRPMAGALVEIWQVDARGHYAVETSADRDPGFSGYGTQIADEAGHYMFKTIRPRGYGRYGGLIKRAAHIHMRVSLQGQAPLATEIWFAGEPGNERDTFVGRVADTELRERMLVRLTSGSDAMQTGVFDVVLANTSATAYPPP